MKKVFCLLAVLVLCIQAVSFGGITMEVYASSAPNASGSSSWSGYVSNAIYALENGLSVNGDISTDPTAYARAADTILPGDIAVTSFHSWQGDVNPTGAFTNELGNRLHFGIHILGNGTQFCIADLNFVMTSSDSTNSLGIVYNGGYNYSASYVGINYGADRIKGTSDDSRITSGASSQLVDELVGRGSGNAWWPGGDLTDRGASDPQGAMDSYLASLKWDLPIEVTGTYSLTGGPSAFDSVLIVPEPGSIVLILSACFGLFFLFRRVR